MTLAEKEQKIKLIYLIIIVQTEYAKRKPFKDVWETIAFGYEVVWWAKELQRIKRIIPFEKGGIVYESPKPEIIVGKRSKLVELPNNLNKLQNP